MFKTNSVKSGLTMKVSGSFQKWYCKVIATYNIQQSHIRSQIPCHEKHRFLTSNTATKPFMLMSEYSINAHLDREMKIWIRILRGALLAVGWHDLSCHTHTYQYNNHNNKKWHLWIENDYLQKIHTYHTISIVWVFCLFYYRDWPQNSFSVDGQGDVLLSLSPSVVLCSWVVCSCGV